MRTRPPWPRPPRGQRGAHLVDAQHGAPEGAAQPAQLGPQRLQTLGPEGRGRLVELTTERGCHGVDDHQAGHAPRQQHRHLLMHTLQQGVLEAERRWPSPPARGTPSPRPALGHHSGWAPPLQWPRAGHRPPGPPRSPGLPSPTQWRAEAGVRGPESVLQPASPPREDPWAAPRLCARTLTGPVWGLRCPQARPTCPPRPCALCSGQPCPLGLPGCPPGLGPRARWPHAGHPVRHS